MTDVLSNNNNNNNNNGESSTPLSLRDVERLISGMFSDMFIKIESIHRDSTKIQASLILLPELSTMMKQMIETQTVMANAATSMADTFKKAESRQNSLETTNTILYTNKGVSLTIFLTVVVALLAMLGMLVSFISDTTIKGSLTNIEMRRRSSESAARQTEFMDEVKDHIREEGANK